MVPSLFAFFACAGSAPPPEAPAPALLHTAAFIDAHAHPAGLGRKLAELDLADLPTYRATLDRIAQALADDERAGRTGWLVGRGWDQNDWPDRPEVGWPLARDLDALTQRPVALRRIDGHATWVNTAALREAGIGPDQADPPGGRVLEDATGAPLGVLVDNAASLVEPPPPSAEEQERRLRLALDAIAGSGLGGVHDMGVDDTTLAIYERLDRAGELRVRVWAYLDPSSQAAARLLREGPWRGRHLAVVGLKLYADGALGSRGALLSAPYADEPDRSGLEVQSAEEIARLTEAALAARAQVAVHAIGDLAVTRVLDAFEAARRAHPEAADLPLRIEHAQVVRPEDRPRFAALRVVASMQPTHATSDLPWAGERLGPDRLPWAYSWRALLDAGAPLAFGSDFPVEDVAPARGVWAATTRTTPRGEPAGGWSPDQRLTLDETIAAFTTGAWAAVGEAPAADTATWSWNGDRAAPLLVPHALTVDGQSLLGPR